MPKIYKVFPGGKFKVLTLSYDDGKNEDRKLLSILNKYGIRGTFNLNSGLVDMDNRINPEEWVELYQGHEVATHTATHPTIDRCPTTEIVQEILNDRIYLEKIMGYPIRGHAYPNGSYSPRVERILEDLGIKYARIVGDEYAAVSGTKTSICTSGHEVFGDAQGFGLPTNLYEWKATCHHNHNLLGFGEEFKALFKKQYLYLMYVWGHSFEFERDNNWNVMEEFCQMMGDSKDIWFATNIEIVDYLEAFDRLQFAADLSFVYNPSATSVWLMIDGDRLVEAKGGETIRLY